MTDSTQSGSAQNLAATLKEEDRRVVRDPTFTRVVVDEILPLPLGRDIELSCLQFSPLLHAMIDNGDHYSPDSETVYAEVARIRIALGDAVDMAMRILHQGILSDRIRGTVVAESIAQWTAEAEAEKGENGAA